MQAKARLVWCIFAHNLIGKANAMVELKNITLPWDRERFLRDNDWAEFGKESSNRVVDAWAAELYKL